MLIQLKNCFVQNKNLFLQKFYNKSVLTIRKYILVRTRVHSRNTVTSLMQFGSI